MPNDDEQSNDEHNNDTPMTSTIKEEHMTLEPTFVNMDQLSDQMYRPNETVTNTEHNHHDIMDCMDKLIEWSEEHNIESLYLKMLHGLRNRIQFKSSSE